MLKLTLYNTETRSKEPLLPLQGNTIRLYTCGPTVYNFVHIGNLRTFLFEDLLRRTIKFFGMQVIQVMNLTDIDDKTIKGALDLGVSLREYTEPYIEAFFEDLRTLNIEPAEHYPAATDFISDIAIIIQRLLDEGIAYPGVDGSIYFAIERSPRYGRLSHLCLEDLKPGASERIVTDEYDKEKVSDFVLWKAYDSERDGDIFWDSPFGPGRPGWHIECSAMAMKILGETIDLHVGGVDLIFPHHENEIAQSEAFSHKLFATHWLHCEHLLIDHRKMSKSLGNFYTLRDLLQKGYSGPQIRYALLQAHYRTQLNFTFPSLSAAAAAIERMADFISRLRAIPEGESSSDPVEPLLQKVLHNFTAALADDMNISLALATLFDLVREGNSLCDQRLIGSKEAQMILALLEKIDTVLGFLPLKGGRETIASELQDALEKRERARSEKNWKEADSLRKFIEDRGYFIEDSPSGARVKKRSI